MSDLVSLAQSILKDWRGERIFMGLNILPKLSANLAKFGRNYFFVHGKTVEENGAKYRLENFLADAGFHKVGECFGARENTPIEDVIKVADELKGVDEKIDFVISFGGGSLIDGVKGSLVLHTLGGECEDYFGLGKVSAALEDKQLPMHVAIITCSASAAHLTKYSNITNFETCQKKLIIDDAIVPNFSAFDYSLSDSMSPQFTTTGAFDALGHLTEVYMGLNSTDNDFMEIEQAILIGVELVISSLSKVLDEPGNLTWRMRLGLASDLGGYAISVGSTNGPHLNSFSLVDLMDHGVAVGILNPYYAYFFSSVIFKKLQNLCLIFKKYGFIDDSEELFNQEHIGELYYNAYQNFAKSVKFPTTLSEIKNFSRVHLDRVLAAAKNPQLQSKLKAMPVAITADDVDKHIAAILNAATFGDLSYLKH